MRIEKLVPEQEFEFKGMTLKAVETTLFGNACEACFFKEMPCKQIPCTPNHDNNPKQQHNLYFIKIPKQNETDN